MKTSIRQKLILFSFLILASNGILGYAVYKINQKLHDSERWVQHTEQVINVSGDIFSIAKDIGIATSSFIITKDATFLLPLYTAKKTTVSYISHLKQLTVDNPTQRQRVDSLSFYMSKLLDFSFKIVEIRSKQGLSATIAYASSQPGKYYIDRINQITNAIQQEEGNLLIKIKIANEHSETRFDLFIVIMFIIMAGFTILLLIITGKYLFQNKEKEQRAAELIIANRELLFQIGEKEKRAAELKKANYLYAFISQVNQNIVRVKDEESLFKNACSIANEYGNFKIAWIGVFDNENKEINCIEQVGIGPEDIKYLKKIPLKANWPQEYVLTNDQYYLSNDILNAPGLESWKQLAAKKDIRSCMILPIKKSGDVIASFNLYSDEVDFFNKEEIDLLTEVAGDISFALDLFEKEKAYHDNSELLIQNEKRFRVLIEKSVDMITLSTIDGELLYVSNSVTTGLGYPVQELLHTFVFDIIHPDDIDEVIKNRDIIIKKPGKSFYYQHRRRHKNGNWIWCEGTLTNMLHEPGIYAMVSNFRDISEKKTAERQQEFDSNNLDALINNTEDLMWSVDTQFNLITSNRPFKKMVQMMAGNSLKEGKNILLAGVSIDQTNRYKKSYEHAFSGESFTEEEYTASPVQLWSEISYCPIRKGDEVIGTACHSRDITERKLAEEELLLTQFAIDNAGDAVFWMTADARIVKVNEAACLMLGYSQQEMLELSVPDIDPDFNTEKWLIHYEELRQKGSLFFETVQQANDGRLIPVEIRANYIKFGDVEFNCAFSRDISERKIGEKNLLHSESSLKEAQSIAHIGNFEVDLVNYNESWSDEVFKIFEINKHEAKPSKELFLSFIHPDDVGNIRADMDEWLTSYHNSNFYFRFINKSGTIRYGYSEARFEFDENNKPVRLFGILQDVTNSKLAEIERTKMVNDLMLKNNDLEQFAYIISHNLRAPIANIIGAANVLEDTSLTTADREKLIVGISASVMKLDDVVKDLNNILEVKGSVNEHKEKVNFSKLVNEIKSSIKNITDKNDVEIKCDFSQVNEFFTLKPYLYSIFYNLIYNSIKYRQKNIPCIIEIKSTKEKNTIKLAFADNCIGIDLEKHGNNMFGLYKRFHGGIEGKGVGLYMVKTQVETLGGTINVKSAENEGTEFIIEFEV